VELSVSNRFEERARAWDVSLEHTLETETSLIGYGQRKSQPVVLKVLKRPGDEWASGKVVRAFQGHGVVRVHEYVDGALLLERLTPGHSLVNMVLDGRDDDAVDVVVDVMRQMTGRTPPPTCATVLDWAKGFERHSSTGDRRIPQEIVEEGQGWFLALASSQQNPRLLHGDLQHYNILFDSTRGWLAIDPKGVVGETEYEIGAVLRNPTERPDLFVSPATIERRLTRFASALSVDFDRSLGWGFAQAVLSAIWSIEDGFTLNAVNPALRLAAAIRVMLPPCP
jgi:streptomycin 6-kinase